MPLKIFVAKLPGQCAICHQEVQDHRVLYNKEKQLVHADCQFPDKAGQKQSRTRPEVPKAYSSYPNAITDTARLTRLKEPAPTTDQILAHCKSLAEEGFPETTQEGLCGLTTALINYERSRHWFEVKE